MIITRAYLDCVKADHSKPIAVRWKTRDSICQTAKAITSSGRIISVHWTYALSSEMRMYNDTDKCWITDWHWTRQ